MGAMDAVAFSYYRLLLQYTQWFFSNTKMELLVERNCGKPGQGPGWADMEG